MVIKIQYPNHYSILVCQYTSVLPEKNVKDKAKCKKKNGETLEKELTLWAPISVVQMKFLV